MENQNRNEKRDWKPDAFTNGLVSKRVRQLADRGRDVGWDADDIRNELLLNVWRRQERFDRQRGSWTTFVRLVTDHQVADLVARWRRHERLAQRNSGPMELEETVDDQAHARRLGVRPPENSLTADMVAVLEQLSDEERRLCHELQLHSIAEVARKLGCSRVTVYQRIRRIRLLFERAGMRAYL